VNQPDPPGTDRVYFRQLLAGRDYATGDLLARQMVNFVYLIGDRETHEVLLVDPAYRVRELVDLAAADGFEVTGVLATHYHADHCGGSIMGHRVEGLRELLALDGFAAKVHVQRDEAEWVKRSTGVSDSDLALHDSGDVVHAGALPVTLLHTPGHTPGSQCFLVGERLVAGDTLFLEGCGRTDLPGSDPDAMYESLTQRLARVPDTTVLYPGHLYSREPSATMGETRRNNFVFHISSLETWRALMGG
jgi:glyoxylase-like metal-dependent hydrolase (beta-lactamase superfamily II)